MCLPCIGRTHKFAPTPEHYLNVNRSPGPMLSSDCTVSVKGRASVFGARSLEPFTAPCQPLRTKRRRNATTSSSITFARAERSLTCTMLMSFSNCSLVGWARIRRTPWELRRRCWSANHTTRRIPVYAIGVFEPILGALPVIPLATNPYGASFLHSHIATLSLLRIWRQPSRKHSNALRHASAPHPRC